MENQQKSKRTCIQSILKKAIKTKQHKPNQHMEMILCSPEGWISRSCSTVKHIFHNGQLPLTFVKLMKRLFNFHTVEKLPCEQQFYIQKIIIGYTTDTYQLGDYILCM